MRHNEIKNYQELIGEMSPRPYQKSINAREAKLKQREIDMNVAHINLKSRVNEINQMTNELKIQLTEMQNNFDRKSAIKP